MPQYHKHKYIGLDSLEHKNHKLLLFIFGTSPIELLHMPSLCAEDRLCLVVSIVIA